ncbi:MAG: hypothetical protein IPK50_08555 [Fibrobacterota bacterium]|nr:MAG: hypothetical protein IPK50_08555 [Fibrobacterota bacterium]
MKTSLKTHSLVNTTRKYMDPKTISLLLLVFLSSIPCAKPIDKPSRKEILNIIEQIPRQEEIARYRALLSPEVEASVRTATTKAEDLEQAAEGMENLKSAIPKLRKLLIVGSSIFDYPGLLSRGLISYDESGDTYRMYIGAYFRDHEGSGPYDFQIFFDRLGKITAVKSVLYKH